MNAMERQQSWIYLVVYLQWVPGRLIPESV